MTQPLSRRSFMLSSLALAASNYAPLASASDDWPHKPVRVYVTTAIGSGSDLQARALSERLATIFHQPFIVDNKPGANGAIATMSMLRAEPDGHTLLYSTASATVMAEALLPKLPFSTLRDMAPVALTVVGGVLFVANPEFPAHTLPELVEEITRNPGKYSYGSWGVGSNGHLTMEWLKQRTGIKAQHVPYKSSQVLLTDLVSGVIPIGWLDLASPLPFLENGRLRGIAINGDTRNPRLPNLKTMGEQGYPFPAKGFQGLFAPVGTPPAIVQRLNTAANRILEQPDYLAMLRQLNVDAPHPTTPAGFRDLIADNLRIWKEITSQANIQLDS